MVEGWKKRLVVTLPPSYDSTHWVECVMGAKSRSGGTIMRRISSSIFQIGPRVAIVRSGSSRVVVEVVFVFGVRDVDGRLGGSGGRHMMRLDCGGLGGYWESWTEIAVGGMPRCEGLTARAEVGVVITRPMALIAAFKALVLLTDLAFIVRKRSYQVSLSSWNVFSKSFSRTRRCSRRSRRWATERIL